MISGSSIEKMKDDLKRILCSYRCIYLINDEKLSKMLLQRIICKDILILTDRDNLYEICLELYRLYEFTDKILLLSDSCSYPMLANFLEQGILTEDELIEALLYKIG